MEEDIRRLAAATGERGFHYRVFDATRNTSNAGDGERDAGAHEGHGRHPARAQHHASAKPVHADRLCLGAQRRGPSAPGGATGHQYGTLGDGMSLLDRLAGPAMERRRAESDTLGCLLMAQSGGVGATTVTSAMALLLAGSGWPVVVSDNEMASMMPYALGGLTDAPAPLGSHMCAGAHPGAVAFCRVAEQDIVGFMEAWHEMRSWQPQDGAPSRAKLALLRNPATDTLDTMLASPWPVFVILAANIKGIAYVDWLEHDIARRGATKSVNYVIGLMDEHDPMERRIHAAIRARLGNRLVTPPIPRDSAVCEAMAEGQHAMLSAPKSPAALALHALVARMLDVAVRGETNWRIGWDESQ